MKTRNYCSVDGCTRPCKGHGYCNLHYQRWRRYGDPLKRKHDGQPKPCSVDGCDENVLSRGYCSLHYQRWRKHGDPLAEPPRRDPVCRVEGCTKPVQGDGLCNTHYMRRRRLAPGARAAESERAYYRAHGLSPEGWQALWDAQGGYCRLCGVPMQPRNGSGSAVKGSWWAAVVHHDHGCCPEGRSCEKCRVLAHNRCNRIAGLAGDDPALLRRIAEGLVT